ncbi:MAG TPA: pentapeptide repeat-containing protein [Candidatus Acidoferrales bacterium]|nr:pentapeptide repeat-containing protein [Candidatus Acidoferrales bacterium]
MDDAEELLRRYGNGERNFRGIVLPPFSDLSGKDLSGANFERASLRGANLSGANLSESNLSGAELREAKLHGAQLQDADLRGADLRNADLAEAGRLLAAQLAGADLAGARIPDEVGRFEALRNIEESSDNGRKLLFSLLLACVYVWLTLASTTDAALLTNSASSPLPIIGAPIPIVGFYLAAPILLLVLYLYLHLNLQRLWEALAGLPAVFPDGKPLHQVAYPWLLNGLVCSYLPRLRSLRPPLSRLQTALSIFVAWWVGPVTMFFLWGRYLRRHDWMGTTVHVTVLAVFFAAAILFHRLAAETLRNNQPKRERRRRAYARAASGALFLAVAGALYWISFGAIEGVHPDSPLAEAIYSGQSTELRLRNVRVWAPRLLRRLGLSAFADLREVEVSLKPANWTGQGKDEMAQVKRARLRARNLRFADGYRAFMAGADLKAAELTGAYLFQADLREADLSWAVLRQCFLSEANLRQANLQNANLEGADLSGADLRQANLAEAQLQGSRLGGAKLDGANLRGADLSTSAGLTASQVRSALTDAATQLPEELKELRTKK